MIAPWRDEKAKRIYLSATEGNLIEAKNFIKALVESEAPEAQSAGPHKEAPRPQFAAKFRCAFLH